MAPYYSVALSTPMAQRRLIIHRHISARRSIGCQCSLASRNSLSQRLLHFPVANLDFHPRQVREWLERIDLKIERTLTVSHLRSRLLKRLVPVSILAGLDGLLQPTGALWQYTPSVFVRARTSGGESGNASTAADVPSIFKCPNCGGTGLMPALHRLDCQECGSQWGEADGIYDFRHPLRSDAAAQRPA